MDKILIYIKEKRKMIVLIISFILFTIITYYIFNDKIKFIDELIQSYILSIRNDLLTNLLTITTNISSPYALISLSTILLLVIKNKKTPLLIIMNLICSFILNQLAKLIFSRPRPIGINLIEETGFSYPSGHAMISMAYFGFIAYLIFKSNINKLIKFILVTLLMITIILIGFSRIYLGVHYLSDILGGFFLSIVYLIIYIKILKISNKKKV